MKTFKLSPVIIFIIKASFWVFLTLTVVLDFYLIFTAHADAPLWSIIFVVLIVGGIFGGIALLCWVTMKRIPWMDLGADRDGIWTLYDGKDDGLVPWEKIRRIRERPWMQRLDLEDDRGRCLLRVEYQLNDFSILRKMILKQFRENQTEAEASPPKFSRGKLHHLENILGLGFMTLLTWGVAVEFGLGWALALAALTIFGLHDYLNTVTGLEITGDEICLKYPLRKKYVIFSQLAAIEMKDRYHRGYRIPGVQLEFRTRERAIHLAKLGVDATHLHTRLHRAAGNSLASEG